MKNLKGILLLVFISCFANAQDSIKKINHEIGFNTVSLIKQVISNNPSTTLPQLPYDVFYNLYFKDKWGFRMGLGLINRTTTTDIEGQKTPRKTTNNATSARFGLSCNFVRHNRITLNAFVDALYGSAKIETANTQTVQSFGDPVHNITTTTTDKIAGSGAQIGVGLKYNLYKHLSIYAEVPFSFLSETLNSNVVIKEDGEPDEKTVSKSTNKVTKITVPTTIYLVLRF